MKIEEEMVDLSKYNLSSKILCGLIFQSGLPTLVEFGLKNIYLDDYGYKCKYDNCVFFLFNVTYKMYNIFEKKIAQFESFYDWYDVDETKRMIVFKIGTVYLKDFQNFKNQSNTEFSNDFMAVVPKIGEHLLKNYKLDYSKEIYRYNLIDE